MVVSMLPDLREFLNRRTLFGNPSPSQTQNAHLVRDGLHAFRWVMIGDFHMSLRRHSGLVGEREQPVDMRQIAHVAGFLEQCRGCALQANLIATDSADGVLATEAG